MYRTGWVRLWAAAVILGTVHCRSSEPEPAPTPAQPSASTSTAALQSSGNRCSTCLDIHLNDYNLFLFEDYSGGHHISGKLAAGGHISMSGLSVGSELPDDNVANTLVAGGNLTLSSGSVYGATWYGGSYTPSWSVNFHRGTAAQGTPIDFAARYTELRSLSSRLAAQPVNGTTLPQWGNLYLTGTDPCLNVFEVSASAFNSANSRNISVPEGSFVLVNIRGTGPSFKGGFGEGLNPRRVLYNFVEATSLDARGFGMQGTALAPHAHVTLNEGIWTGGLYARSLRGGASFSLSPLEEQAGTTEEVCNGADDDCNGQVDEGFECTGTSSRSCTAWCGTPGTQSCDPATCGYGECVSDNCCRADADCGDGTYCEGTTCAARLENGASCSRSSQCASEQCVDGVCCNTACAGECDACNLAGSAGTCSPAPTTVQCRASGGVCDVAEFCTGSAAECPVDTKQPSTTVCRSAADTCDVAESCTGTSDTCPEDGYAPTTVQCRASGGVCDVAEFCTGSAAECPVDTKQPSITVCRSAADACDVAESCTGTSDTCPGDGYAPTTVQCRVSVGECDVAEFCTGTGESCPGDGFRSSGEDCTSDGNACTVDMCDGNGSCTHPQAPAGASCGMGQACDATGQCQDRSGCWIAGAYYEAGATNPSAACQECDPNQSTSSWSFKPTTTQCRVSGGECDVAEFCTGSTAECPADAKQPSTTLCRGSTDTCDATEYCTGTSDTCPEDGYAPRTTQCRASSGECDVAEYCTGTGASCPADGFRSPNEDCTSDGNACTRDMCNGSGLCTHPPSPVGTSCQDGNACTTGDVCNGAGSCGGMALSCDSPPNTQCYQAAGTCSNGACSYVPKSAGTPCNDNNACTKGDTCNGVGACTGTELSCSTASSYYCSGNNVRKTTGTGSCSGGSCGSTDSHVETCSTSSSYYCSGNERWKATGYGCSNGSCDYSDDYVQTCATSVSSPYCSGNTVYQTVNNGCSGGSCMPSTQVAIKTCSPTTSYSCSGNEVRQTTTGFCSGSGCGGSSTTTVQTCSPTTSYSCNGNQVQQRTTGLCSGSGCGGSSTTTVQTCLPTTSYYCSGNDVRQSTTGLCSGSGCGGSSDTYVQTCGSGQQCSNGVCVTVNACQGDNPYPSCDALNGTSCSPVGATRRCCTENSPGYCNCVLRDRTGRWFCT
ncbi:choice-of-anchor A family protein [Stigmatella erecta]|uniref:Choice-of-anchor A domain-containing protein n=1 Tax=Stigmatella erecta TaxID=83460 RepID=A0A1I0IVC9_9BACT|nr:choice-of-anchor A family protein [Stigmatella erecta]SEU01337.1 choice-of-anchor A domain-containing protein [Stigmatella erecta]